MTDERQGADGEPELPQESYEQIESHPAPAEEGGEAGFPAAEHEGEEVKQDPAGVTFERLRVLAPPPGRAGGG